MKLSLETSDIVGATWINKKLLMCVCIGNQNLGFATPTVAEQDS